MRRIDRDRVEAEAHGLAARELADMQAHMRHLEHVGVAERVRIHDAVLAEGDVDSVGAHLAHAREAAPFRISVMSSLNDDVDERIRNGMDAGLRDQRQGLET